MLGFGGLAPFHFWPKLKVGFFVPRFARLGKPRPRSAGYKRGFKTLRVFQPQMLITLLGSPDPNGLLARSSVVTH